MTATHERDALGLARGLLRRVRHGEPTHEFEAALRDLPRADLAAALADADARLAFWINVYNAHVQLLLAASPEQFRNRRAFFSAPVVAVAGADLSLDDVEHGLLRRSHPKWGLGYVPNPFAGGFERRFRVAERDPRVHFALNCGAASCPPVAAYRAGDLDDQLDAATAAYLEREVAYDAADGVVRVPRLLLWYRGDFGGRQGILELLWRHDLIPRDATPRLTYGTYDWSLSPGQYADDRWE